MIFSTEQAFNIEKNDKSFLEGGIHEGVRLTGVRNEKSTNGNSFIEFEFNKNGAVLTHTEWEPTKRADQTDEEMASKVNNQVARVLQIMSVFYDKATLSNFTATTFAQFGIWVKSLLDAADKTKLLRIKAIYNPNGFTSLPKYAKYTFIESMDVELADTKIKKLGIDTFERPEQGDKEVAAKSSSETFTSTPIPSSDIPF